jgi:hypothetical protein
MKEYTFVKVMSADQKPPARKCPACREKPLRVYVTYDEEVEGEGPQQLRVTAQDVSSLAAKCVKVGLLISDNDCLTTIPARRIQGGVMEEPFDGYDLRDFRVGYIAELGPKGKK